MSFAIERFIICDNQSLYNLFFVLSIIPIPYSSFIYAEYFDNFINRHSQLFTTLRTVLLGVYYSGAMKDS